MTSILQPAEAEKMVHLADELSFDFIDVEYELGETLSESSDVEDMRRFLEDTLTLVDLTEDPDLDLDELEKNRPAVTYDDDEDDDDDDDDE